MNTPIIISDSHREDNCPVLPASLRAGLTVLVTGLCMVSPLAAQKLYLSPTIGAYIPTTELIKASQGEEFKQEIAVSVGGRLGLNAGASLVKRGGDAYANLEDKSDVGGVVGATVGFNLGSFLSLYVAADDYIYGTTFVDENTLQEKQTQNDIHLSLGFGLPLNK